MQMKSTRRYWIVGVAAVMAGLAYSWWRPVTMTVQSTAVMRGPLTVMVEEQGQTRARSRYTVAAPVTGQLLRTSVAVGDRVTQGEVLARIMPEAVDVRELSFRQAELAATQAQAAQVRAQVQEALSAQQRTEAESQRRQRLLAQGLIGREIADQFAEAAQAASARLSSVRAALRAAQSQVESAQARLLGLDSPTPDVVPTLVMAPVSGSILRVHEESARVVAAGAALFDIRGDSGLELVIDVLTEDAVSVQAGAEVWVRNWGGAETLKARVRLVEPGAYTKISTLGVEEQRVDVIADLSDPADADRMGAGYRIEAAIVTWSGTEVLQLPLSALFRRQGQWQVFAIDAGIARLRAVEIGHRGKDAAEVLLGLVAGDQVIVFPSAEIEDGVHVKLKFLPYLRLNPPKNSGRSMACVWLLRRSCYRM